MKRNDYYMDLAQYYANKSITEMDKVGCVVVNSNGNLLVTGYNTTVDYSPCEKVDNKKLLVDYNKVIHAVQSAIAEAASTHISLKGSTMYITSSPYPKHASLIIMAKISKVIYKEESANIKGIELLKKHGVYVEKLQQISK